MTNETEQQVMAHIRKALKGMVPVVVMIYKVSAGSDEAMTDMLIVVNITCHNMKVIDT